MYIITVALPIIIVETELRLLSNSLKLCIHVHVCSIFSVVCSVPVTGCEYICVVIRELLMGDSIAFQYTNGGFYLKFD